MKGVVVILAYLLFPLFLFSQSDSLMFSGAIKINFKYYKKASAAAYRKGDTERGKFLFDSLVQRRLAGTTFDDFTFKKASGGKLKLSAIKKPVILITYASWCVPSPGEYEALNKLAQKYSKEVTFIALFWNRKEDVRKAARKLSRHVTVCYAHESYRNDGPIVAAMKHTLGLPTSYYLDENRKVVDIRRCGVQQCPKKTPYNKAYALNYNSFLDGLALILIDKEVKKEMLATK